jgi:NAD(P)-dependent dehydrogenase (short-subunit alcohol dehydrogenase family)
MEALEPGLFTLLELARALPQGGATIPIAVVGRELFSVTGVERPDPCAMSLLGAVAVMPQEMPWLRCAAVDIGPADATSAKAVAQALLSDSGENVRAIRHGALWHRRFDRLPAAPEALELPTGGLCLVAGGLGAVGRTLGAAVARRFGLNLLLVSRNAEARPSLPDDLRGQGIQVATARADVTRADELRRVLDEADPALGEPCAFLHCAGVAASDTEHWVANSTREDWRRIMAPKLLGATALDEVLAEEALGLGYFASSLSSVAGGQGLAAYSAAHATLDAFVLSKRGRRPYLSVAWDGWTTWAPGTVAPDTEAARQRAAWAISPEDAVAANGHALSGLTEGRVFVSRVDLAERLRPVPVTAARPETPVAHRVPHPKVSSVEDRVLRLTAELLGGRVDPEGNFFDYGGDSLKAVELVRRVNLTFGTELSPPDLFATPTVRGLAAVIEGGPPSVAPAAGDRRQARRNRRAALRRA